MDKKALLALATLLLTACMLLRVGLIVAAAVSVW
jgi:hypothetical protein